MLNGRYRNVLLAGCRADDDRGGGAHARCVEIVPHSVQNAPNDDAIESCTTLIAPFPNDIYCDASYAVVLIAICGRMRKPLRICVAHAGFDGTYHVRTASASFGTTCRHVSCSGNKQMPVYQHYRFGKQASGPSSASWFRPDAGCGRRRVSVCCWQGERNSGCRAPGNAWC